MSIRHDVRRGGRVAGATALPLPGGDPGGLARAARELRRAGADASATRTVTGAVSPLLEQVWSGAAADAATNEATELASRAQRITAAAPRVAAALTAYASAFELARGRVRRLQREWDDAHDRRDSAMVRLELSDVAATTLAERGLRLDSELDAARARLSRSHDAVLDELGVAEVRCAGTVTDACDGLLPPRIAPVQDAVRRAVTGGLPSADGVLAQREAQRHASADAGLARRVLGDPGGRASAAGSSGSWGGDASAVRHLTERVAARAHDPAYAQALLDTLGVDGVARLLAQVGGTSHRVPIDEVRALAGALGSALLRAIDPDVPGADPRTAREVASRAALLADEVVARLGRTYADESGATRTSGYWLLAQTLVATRVAGDARPLPPALVRRLVAGTATAEVAETRDHDALLRHGTTLRPDHGASFASWFDDPERTGDALHVLLGEVSDDRAEQAALLLTPLADSEVAGAALENARGDRLTVAEQLVRRWRTYEANGPRTSTGLELATGPDLLRLLAGAGVTTGGSDAPAELVAELRARTMIEVQRTSAGASAEPSTARLYERHDGPLQSATVGWVAPMRASIDRVLDASALTVPASGYVSDTAGRPVPLLRRDELVGLVGAYAVGTAFARGALPPADDYVHLVDAELAHVRARADRGLPVSADVTRLGFIDHAASTALVCRAREMDDIDRSMWRGLAEAANVGTTLRRDGPRGLREVVTRYATEGTMRTAFDDLAISVVRSDVELDQTRADDERRGGLELALAGATGWSMADVHAAVVRGAGKAPALPTPGQLVAARRAEVRAAFDAWRDEGAQLFLEDAAELGERRLDERRHRLDVAEGTDGRIPDLDSLPRGTGRAKVVDTEAELRDLYDRLSRGGQHVDTPGLVGERVLRPDGVYVSFRDESRSGGATIDLRFPDGSTRKVHLR